MNSQVSAEQREDFRKECGFRQEITILATILLIAVIIGPGVYGLFGVYSSASISFGNTFEVNSAFYWSGSVVANVYTTWTFAYDQTSNQFVIGHNTFWGQTPQDHADWPFSISASGGASKVTTTELYSNVSWTFGWFYGGHSGTTYNNIGSTNNGKVTVYWGFYGGPDYSATDSLPLNTVGIVGWGS